MYRAEVNVIFGEQHQTLGERQTVCLFNAVTCTRVLIRNAIPNLFPNTRQSANLLKF